MTKKRSITIGICVLLVCLALLFAAYFAVGETNEEAQAAAYRVSMFKKPAEGLYYNGTQDVTFSVFMNQEAYDAYYLQIRYQRVKLNSVVDTVTQSHGKASNVDAHGDPVYEVLDEEVVVEKADLKTNGTGGANYAYFDVTTRVNCAWIFTFIYRAYAEDELHSECSSDILYCTRIDDHTPTVSRGSTVISGDAYKITAYVNDQSATTMVSGLRRLRLFKRTAGNEDELLEEKDLGAVSKYTYVVTVQSGSVEYLLQAEDCAGNTTDKVRVAQFTDQTYDADAEYLARYAVQEFGRAQYASWIQNGVTDAWADYLVKTRDETETEDDKRLALEKLNEQLSVFTEARLAYQENGVKTTITNTDPSVLDTLTLTGTKEALAFLPIGDEVEITITPTKGKYAKDKAAELAAAGMDKASYVVTVTVATSSRSEFTVRRELSSPYVLAFKAGEYETVKAVQKIVSPTGGVSYEECLVVEYADGSMRVEAPYSAGTVYVFFNGEEKNYVWLFYLLPIPLVPGVVLLVFGLVKMKKVKEKALKEREEGKEEEKKEETTAPKPVPKNKKKKK